MKVTFKIFKKKVWATLTQETHLFWQLMVKKGSGAVVKKLPRKESGFHLSKEIEHDDESFTVKFEKTHEG